MSDNQKYNYPKVRQIFASVPATAVKTITFRVGRKMKILINLLSLLGIAFGLVPDCNGAVCRGCLNLQAEVPVIRLAAERNGIKFGSDDWFILLAIRRAENGRSGCEFSIKHPRAWQTNLDTQAGWAAATIVKHHKRFGDDKVTIQFINSLADRYCPKFCDPIGNGNWKKNVRFWFRKLKEAK
jgi:hypothetical protein